MMIRYIADDIVRVYAKGEKRSAKSLLAVLFWGDKVKLVETEGDQRVIDLGLRKLGVLPPKARLVSKPPVLKVRFVDVGQGDGALIETPEGHLVAIDGGEEEHFRRYLSTCFGRLEQPLDLSAIIVTHGDADHFAGLTRLLEGIPASAGKKAKTVAVTRRVFHNGLVKAAAPKKKAAEEEDGETGLEDKELFGKTQTKAGVTYVTGLVDDLLTVPDNRLNKPFRDWKNALLAMQEATGQPVETYRLAYGDDEKLAFLESDKLRVNVLGPIVDEVNQQDALKMLSAPGSRSVSASHTINGHSIVLKLTYGNVRFLFGADLNEESELRLLERARQDGISLAAEVLKVPHHGSADFYPEMLEAVRPVVSIISSGDESQLKEYIHPRAALVGALGKYSRAEVEKPLIYCTEMVAFFQRLGEITRVKPSKGDPKSFRNGYCKTSFGIVHVRTDGERVLVATHSGKQERKEGYVFHVDANGRITFEEPVLR